MSQIKDKNTKPEMLVRKYLHSKGFRYKLHVNTLPGKPDLVLPKYNTILFINGCFWHGHDNCKYFVIPNTRRNWWLEKINSNITNDIKVINELKKRGWNIVIIWECQLKKRVLQQNLEELLNKIKNQPVI